MLILLLVIIAIIALFSLPNEDIDAMTDNEFIRFILIKAFAIISIYFIAR
ncbi:MAG: hypothetical protein MJ209_00350 [archaeon]|nr:hypothetical protein [archaeon]